MAGQFPSVAGKFPSCEHPMFFMLLGGRKKSRRIRGQDGKIHAEFGQVFAKNPRTFSRRAAEKSTQNPRTFSRTNPRTFSRKNPRKNPRENPRENPRKNPRENPRVFSHTLSPKNIQATQSQPKQNNPRRPDSTSASKDKCDHFPKPTEETRMTVSSKASEIGDTSKCMASALTQHQIDMYEQSGLP